MNSNEFLIEHALGVVRKINRKHGLTYIVTERYLHGDNNGYTLLTIEWVDTPPFSVLVEVSTAIKHSHTYEVNSLDNTIVFHVHIYNEDYHSQMP